MKQFYFFLALIITQCISAQGSLGLDLTYGTDGKVITNLNSGEDVARGGILQNDGKLLVAGYTFDSVFGYDFICLRYNQDGSLDTSFGTNGVTQIDLQVGSDDRAYSIDLQLDNKIVIAGFSDDGTGRDGALVRLNSNGSIDSSFGNGGIVITDFGEADEFNVVKVHLVTGNIVCAGTSYRSTTRSNGVFSRYLPDGSLDTSFNNDGKIENLPSPVSGTLRELSIEDMAIKSNGKITAVGWLEYTGQTGSAASHYECRLNTDGSFDPTFSNNGYDFDLMTTAYDYTYGMVANSDDSFEFAGYSRYTTFSATTDRRGYIHRSSSTGGTSFSPTVVQFSESIGEYVLSMGQDNNGNLILGGATLDSAGNSNFDFFVAKLDGTGDNFDPQFGNNGLIRTSFTNDAIAYDLAIQSDNKIILIGRDGDSIALARYTEVTLSTPRVGLDQTIDIYPNPTTGIINIKSATTEMSNRELYIYDISGRNVKSFILNSDSQQINVSDLKAGIYLAKIDNTVIKFHKI